MSKATIKKAPEIPYRVGLRCSDEPPLVHVATVTRSQLTLPDQGWALCGASVVILSAFPGPPDNPWSACDRYCEVCLTEYDKLAGKVLVGKQWTLSI